MRDSDVRTAVRKHLADIHADDPDTRVVEEMGVWSGSARVDIAVINGELWGYELKSDRDTLERLPRQAEIYGLVFDRVTLVVGSKHTKKIRNMVPRWWGLMQATDNPDGVELAPLRNARKNPKQDARLIAELLWKKEALTILEHFDLAKGWRSKRVRFLYERLAKELPLCVLKEFVRDALKRRDNWLGQNCPNQLDMTVHTNLDPML